MNRIVGGLLSIALCLPALCLPLAAQPHSAADLGRAVLAAGLDPNECYRIRDIDISEKTHGFT